MKTHPLAGERLSCPAILATLLVFGASALTAAPARSPEAERERARELDRDRPVVERVEDDAGRRTVVRREKVKNSDRDFVQKVVQTSLEQIEISRIAAERTLNPRIRELADTTIAAYAEIREDLARLAADKGVAVPAKETVAEKWAKRDGKNFDVEFLGKMVDEHHETVKLFQKQALDGEDLELVSFARKHLPALQQQLFHANDLHRRLK